MPSIRRHLGKAQAQLELARHSLKCALRHTETKGYNLQWLHAIDKALANNQETWRQVTNINSLIHPPVELRLPDPIRKEN